MRAKITNTVAALLFTLAALILAASSCLLRYVGPAAPPKVKHTVILTIIFRYIRRTDLENLSARELLDCFENLVEFHRFLEFLGLNLVELVQVKLELQTRKGEKEHAQGKIRENRSTR